MAKRPPSSNVQHYTDQLLPFLIPTETREYWTALGEFVHTFSMVEVNMQCALWEFAGLSRALAIAFLAGSTRIDSAINLMNKIAVARKWRANRKTELQAICTQLGIINKVRNDILHYGADFIDGKWRVSNRAMVVTKARVRVTMITVKSLREMVSDLNIINSRLVYLAWGSFMKPAVRRSFTPLRKYAWRYKQPSRHQRVRKNRKTLRKRPRQPQAWPA